MAYLSSKKWVRCVKGHTVWLSPERQNRAVEDWMVDCPQCGKRVKLKSADGPDSLKSLFIIGRER